MTNPRVSIIILNWNRLEDAVECVEALTRGINYPDVGQFWLIMLRRARMPEP